MCLTDLGAVWAAAHWGAALAVRLRKLRRVINLLAAKLFRVAVAAGVSFIATVGLDLAIGPSTGRVPTLWTLLAFSLFLGLSWWFIVLRPATRAAMESFAWFDYLAMEEGDRPPPAPSFIWRDTWDETARP